MSCKSIIGFFSVTGGRVENIHNDNDYLVGKSFSPSELPDSNGRQKRRVFAR